MKTLPVRRRLEKTRAFSKDVRKLPRSVVEAGWKAAQALQNDILAPYLDIRKLEGFDDVWRIVIKRNYRLVYCFDEDRFQISLNCFAASRMTSNASSTSR